MINLRCYDLRRRTMLHGVTWHLSIAGKRAIEGRTEHLAQLIDALRRYRNTHGSSALQQHDDEALIRFSPSQRGAHWMILRSSRTGVEPLRICLQQRELDDLAAAIAALRIEHQWPLSSLSDPDGGPKSIEGGQAVAGGGMAPKREAGLSVVAKPAASLQQGHHLDGDLDSSKADQSFHPAGTRPLHQTDRGAAVVNVPDAAGSAEGSADHGTDAPHTDGQASALLDRRDDVVDHLHSAASPPDVGRSWGEADLNPSDSSQAPLECATPNQELGDSPAAHHAVRPQQLETAVATANNSRPPETLPFITDEVPDASGLRVGLAAETGTPQAPSLHRSELEVLHRHDVLAVVLRRRIREQLIQSVIFDEATLRSLRMELWHGLRLRLPPIDPDDPDWFLSLDPSTRAKLQERWDDLRLRFWIESTYAHVIEKLFLEKRRDHERWIYLSLRVESQALALELYLQLTEDQVDLGVLASRYDVGDERWTRGIVGPVEAYRVPFPLRQTLENLTTGAIQPPFQLDQTWRVVQMLHRFPAELEGELRGTLLNQLFQADLDEVVERVKQRVMHEPADLGAVLAQLSWPSPTVSAPT